jgi:hypothetical protein
MNLLSTLHHKAKNAKKMYTKNSKNAQKKVVKDSLAPERVCCLLVLSVNLVTSRHVTSQF